MSENQDRKIAPLKQLHEKREYAKTELLDDFPVVALSSADGVYIATIAKAANHDKIDLLANARGVNIVFAGRGNQADLSILKTALERLVNEYINHVSVFDLTGRLISQAAAEILRNHYLNKIKALSVQVIVADPLTPGYPFWATNFEGETIVAKNLTISAAGIQEIKKDFKSMTEILSFAKEFLKNHNGIRQFYQLKFDSPARQLADGRKKTTR